MTTEEIESKKPIVAICYDFDKTLSPENMQSQGFIQKIGFQDEKIFWDKSNAIADEYQMDGNLAWMYEMKVESEGKEWITKEKLHEYGAEIKFFPGVETWFERINEIGEENGVIVEHYIISSGLKEMIEGTQIAPHFKRIFASSFFYNTSGVAVWPAQVVNYTNKTQFLFRIEKGCLEVNDQAINEHFTPDKLRIPFRNIIYIGDSDTDVPCMRLVNSFGGYAIGVYGSNESKNKVYHMMRDDRIKYFEVADYSKDGDLERLVKDIIVRTAINEKIEQVHYACLNEMKDNDEENTERNRLILKLEASSSFKQTHQIFDEMNKIDIDTWTETDVHSIASIVCENSQVSFVVHDNGVQQFLSALFNRYNESDEVKKAKNMLDFHESGH